jgi:hypothetical protein
MRTPILVTLLMIAGVTARGAPAVKLSDEQLRTQITGVWFSEELPQVMRHIAERMQYFPDGRFLGDYRISTPNSEHYIRNAGTWKVSGSQFSEVTEKCSEPGFSIPTLVRHVVVIDRSHMIIETADGTRSELWHGQFALEKGRRSISSVDRQKLFAQLLAMQVSGFRLVPAKKGYSTIRIDTRKIPAPPTKKP